MLSCAIVALSSVVNAYGANGIIKQQDYKICPGDTLQIELNKRSLQVTRDTIIYDTIRVTDPSTDSIYVHVVNVYPSFLDLQERILERGNAFQWEGLTITKAGTYEKVYKSELSGCDSIYRVIVRERVETRVVDTLCIGSSLSFGGQTLTQGGIYRDTLHFSDYDSIVILSLHAVKPDTTIVNRRIPEGTSTTWNGTDYSEAGVYDRVFPNRFGCDSLSRLVLTTYHVDTIDTIVFLCPSETITWHGMTYGETGKYEFPSTRENGDRVYYRLDLRMKEITHVDTLFRICDGEQVVFDGQTYSKAGEYYHPYTCDTIYKVTVVKTPTQLHLQTGVLDATHPYYWQYMLNGQAMIDTLTVPGTYEHTTPNLETGCNDIWRLVLTKDETSYHFIEEQTICANEDFSWRGRTGLNRTGIGETRHYFDNLRTAGDQDSIYELILTVLPVSRYSQTIPFCGEVEWNGTTYTESAVVYDTLRSLRNGCDSIVTTILQKGISFHHHDTATITPGEVISWRGQTITADGQYEERHLTKLGCDSIYSLGVGLREAAPVTNTRTYVESICEGNYYEWRGDKYFNSGVYVDTTFVNGDRAQGIDSLYILKLTVNPVYTATERITFTSFPATYREWEFTAPGSYHEFRYKSSTGCDSVITVYADLEVIKKEETVTVCPSELPYRWRDHEFYESYRYVETEKDRNGNDSVQYILNLTVKYIPETRVTKTICQGGSYTFGDRLLTETGVYKYTFKESGCDSVVVLSLNVVKPDTNIFVHHMDAGQSYVWNETTYRATGTYYDYRTNRFGCDSINILELTVNHVDTIDTTAVICPNEIPFYWHGIRASQTNDYTITERQANGDYTYYRLHLTVRELVQIDTTFTICGDEAVVFNGKTYNQGGRFFDYLSCDTVIEVNIHKQPQQVYVTTASLGGGHGYTWTYWENGVEKTGTFDQPGTYEYESSNAETGCSELWRLVLSKDETSYHFVETLTKCEGEEFEWHGLSGLTNQGIGAVSNYEVKYLTRTGQDSIYELILTVNPIERTTKVIPFCGEYTLNGKRYTESTTVVDTLSTSLGCYSIVTTVLQKGQSFHRHDTATIVPGETLYWHGQIITNQGYYTDPYTTVSGCDSIYSIGVGMKEAAEQMKMRTWNEEICEGDTLEWRNKRYYNTGTYVDTIKIGSTNAIDSLYVLNLTVNPTYLFRERITFHTFPGTYRGHEFTRHGETDTIRYTTVHGCDSIYIVTAERELTRTEDRVTICTGDFYRWAWNGIQYSESGRYVITQPDANGNDSVEHILNLTVRNIPETYVTETICKGGSYTFGDRNLTESGEYEYTFRSGSCDSIVHLSLNVVHADTNRLVHHMNEGERFEWNDKVYYQTGTYFFYGTNRFGCDSVAVLELTINHVDTIDTTVIACQRELPIVWHGISASQSGDYSGTEQKADGGYNYYRLHLTVRPIVQIDTTFTICDDEQVVFNGKIYKESGRFFDYLSCDTVIEVNIHKHPQRVYETRAALGQDKYTWTYGPADQRTTVEYDTPGTYEFEFPNEVTGCSEIWRLVLTQDMSEYHFTERLEICEGEDFTWHGMANMSHQYIGEEHVYTAEYKTRNLKDSIYTLYLTVKPLQRTYRTINFCGETTYKGVTYTHNAVVRDTMIGANGCDSIIEINLNKTNSYFFRETKDLPQGKVYNWHGIDIYTDGVYRDEYQTQYGCDSIYELRVTIIPATPETNQYSEQWSICAGDTVLWRGKDLWRGGTYVDTVWTAGKEKVDSIFTLNLNVWPSYRDTIIRHLYNCNDGAAIQYNGKLYYDDDTVVTVFPTIHGCDSIEKVFMHFNTALFMSDTAKIADNKLPYEWRPNNDTTILLSATGTYQYTKEIPGGCNNTWELHLIVYPTFYYKDSVVLCANELPYYWLNGPADHVNDGLSAAAGETKLVTYTYSSAVTGADSIYQLKMTVKEMPYSIEQLYICAGDQETLPNGKTYNSNTMVPDSIYRDTIVIPTPTEGCDSTVYYEIMVRPIRSTIQTEIKHLGDSVFWMGDTITNHVTRTYTKDSIDEVTGCKITNQLRVIAEHRDEAMICVLDTPFVWSYNNKKYYGTGLYTDTVFDGGGFITEYHALNLKVKVPVDTTIYLRGCLPAGVTFNDNIYLESGIYRDTLACDTMYTIHVKVDTIHEINLTDTICEEFLPYILGRQDPDTIWAEGLYHHTDTTACGCDSVVNLNLRIIPKLTKNDSTFICEDIIREKPVILGDTVTPWFDFRNGGLFHGTWEGKWHGVSYTTDTIVWNCDSSYFHHIIVRPRQEQPVKDTFYLCQGDSVQLFWPHSALWVDTPGVYYDTIPTNSPFYDEKHGYTHNDRDYLCDSIVEWTVLFADTLHEEKTVHIAMGDSILFDGQWRYAAGDYDSIAQAVDTNSYGEHCKYVMTMHLYVDSTYHFRDTMSICEYPSKEIAYTWADGYSRIFTLPKHDSAFHVIDTLPTLLYRFDSIYDLYVDYHRQYFTQLRDTICEGDSLRFDIHHRDNSITQRYLTTDGIYYDTIPALNGCDSIIELYLKTRDSIPTTYVSHMITDREIPYLWRHSWMEEGHPQEATDTLRATGVYRFTMPSQYGCDSIVVIDFRVHETHIFRDTIDVCALPKTTLTHIWATGRELKFTTPDKDSLIHYYDTLQTRIKYDSIYDLLVNYKEQTITYLDSNLCYGDSIQFGLTKAHMPRFVSKTGEYRDTLVRVSNGCDSIIVLRLNVFPRYLNAYTHYISSTDTPYVWIHNQGGIEIARDSLYAEGEYVYHFTSSYGCDSIDSLSLRIQQTYLFRDTVQICASETPYTWGEKKDIYTTGEYIQYFRTHDNMADSTHVRFVRVMPIEHDTIHATICEGDSMRFGLTKSNQPRFIHMPGLYNDTLTTVHGCDSIITLTLNVYPRHFGDTTVHIANIDTPYIWRHTDALGHSYPNDTLYAEGRYGFRYPSVHGCDSIDSLTLVIHPTYLFRDSIAICQSETPYTWYNVSSEGDSTLFQKGIYESGVYTKHLQTHDGYDSTYVRVITVLPVKTTILHDSICVGENNFYTFRGMKLTENGVYRDTLASVDGCDSIVILNFTAHQPYYNYREEHIIEGQSVTIMGHTFDKDTVFTSKGLTPNGCDSTTVIKVVVHPMVDTVVTICQSELPYQWVNKWNGQITPLYAAGIYRNDTTFIDGTRMFYGLQLVVNSPVFDTIRHAMCEGSSYEFKGNTYTEQGVYRDTLSAANGCDSIVTLILTVNKPYYNVIRETILEGHSYEFYGKTYTTSGNYTHYSRTPEGCDSTTVLQLTVHPIVDTIITVCDVDMPVIWQNRWNGNEQKFFSSGIYRNDTTINGEKRFYGIQVNVNKQVFDTIRHAMCEGSSYEFKGNTYTEQGVYRDTLSAANGCDSIVTLILTVNKPYYNVIRETILEGHSYEFYGETYTTSGNYTHYSRTPEGCDSTTVLQLTVHPIVDTIITVCSYELPYVWNNRWSGATEQYFQAGIYRNDTTINGEKRFFGIQLVVNAPVFDTIRTAICEGSSYQFGGIARTEAGIYRDTLRAANGCDSIETLILTVNKPYYSYQVEHILKGDSVKFFGETYSATGTYTHYGRTPEGCDSTTVLQVIVHPLVDTVVTVCKSDLPYQWINKWNGQITPLYTAGIYRNDTTYVNGERMFYGLQLVVTEPTDTTIYREICEGDLYNFNNRFLGTSGEYRDTIKNHNGCDSIVVLHLNVLKKYYNSIDRSIYEGDTVMFQGISYSTAGIYPVRLSSSYGCDSIIELRLTVIRLFDDSVTVCANDLPYRWTLPSDSTKQMTIYESGIYRDTVVNSEGVQSIIGLKVKVLPIAHAPEPIIARICEGDYYKFGDSLLTVQGTYYDTLTAANGCDSVVMLSLQVQPRVHQVDTRTIFEGDTVMFYGDTCTTSGIYTHTVQNGMCTETYQLILKVLKEFHVDTTAYICKNELPFIWHGIEYNETGNYSLPTAWNDSSRVVTTLHLNVRDAFYGERNVSLCEGNVFIFRRDTFRTSSIFYDTIPSQHGCDSIIKYTLQVHPKYEKWDTVHISDKQTYLFGDPTRELSISGDYESSGLTHSGCDSIIHLHLVVHPSYYFKDSVEICQPDTFKWHGMNITETGTYFDKQLTKHYGFDSIYEVKVTVHPAYFTYEQYLIKEGETTILHGINITKTDSIYTDTLHTIYGCDSIFQIAVNTKRMMEVQRDITICDGEYYDLYGQKLTKAGKYTKMSPNGDTIAHITLTVNPVSVEQKRIVITDEQVPYQYGGRLYYPEIPMWDPATQTWDKDVKTTQITNEYLNQYGCDSTLYLDFVVTTHYSEWNQIPLCSNETLIIDNDTITHAGYYTFVRRSNVTKRMDSLYRVEVYDAPKYEMPAIKRTICEGDTVHFFERTLDVEGEYQKKLKSVDGCDSIITLKLTVTPTIHKETSVRIYEQYLPYIWEEDNRKCYMSGDYVKSWQTGECINTSTLHLTVVQPITEERVICGEDSVKWRNNKWYGTEGYYYDTIYKANTDTITDVFVLHLVKGLPTKVTGVDIAEITEGADEFTISFTTDNGLYYSTKVNILFKEGPSSAFSNIYDATATKNGDRYIVSVTLPQSTDTCYAGHYQYAKPGWYSIQVQLDNGACGREVSAMTDFLVKYPSWIIEQNWDNVVAPLNANCNCGYEFTGTQWSAYHSGSSIPYIERVEAPYLHHKLDAGDQVVMWAMRKGERDYIPTYPLTIVPYTWQQYDDPILVYPSAAPHRAPRITIEAPQGGSYTIYSSTGTLINGGTLDEGKMQVTLPNTCGIYFIRTVQGEHAETHKVVLY